MESIYINTMNDLLTNFTPENIAMLIFGTILYFTMEFKAKSSEGKFSPLYWLKDNWYNLVINLAAIGAYFTLQDSVSKEEAFAVGFAPNYIVDRLVDLKKKYFSKDVPPNG